MILSNRIELRILRHEHRVTGATDQWRKDAQVAPV